MPRYGDDDYEDDDRGHSSYGRESHSHDSHSSSSSYSGREQYGKTSDFSTMVIGKDGKFFGVELPPDMIDKARTVFPMALHYLSDHAYELGLKHSPGAAKIAGYGVALVQQEYEIYQNIRDRIDYLNKLRIALQPLAKYDAGNAGPLSSKYKAVKKARDKSEGLFWHHMLETGLGTVAASFALWNLWNKQAAKHHELQFQHDIEKAKGDPNKLAEILEKEIVIGTSKMGLTGDQLHLAKGKLLEKYRKAFLDEFAIFKKANESTVKTELKNTLKDLKPENIKYDISGLKRQGFDVEQLSDDLKRRWDRKEEKYIEPDENGIKEAITKFQKAFEKKQINGLTERALRAKFVRQKGVALDEDWLDVLGERSRDQNAPPTIARQLEQKIEKFQELERKAKEAGAEGKGQNKEFKGIMEGIKGFAAGAGAVFLRKLFGGKSLEKYAKPIAVDRILHLRKAMEPPEGASDDWKPPEEVPGIIIDAIKETKEEDRGYVQYVHGVFEQQQKDFRWTEIGDRFVTHFLRKSEAYDEDDGRGKKKTHAGWKRDADILKIPDAELTPYEYAIRTIAQRIKNGRMDAIALIPLLEGEIVHSDGRSFGPRQSGGRGDAAVKEAIKRIIDEKTALLHAGQEQTDEQINSKLGDFVFGVDDLKKALESKELEQSQRAFIFTLFSNVVGDDAKLCQKIGVTAERCQELRKECNATFNSMLDGAVVALAEMIEKEPERFKKTSETTGTQKETLELTDKQKELITSLAQRVKEEGKDAADLAGKDVKALETTIANAAMKLGRQPGEEGKPNLWQRIKTAVEKLKEPKPKEDKKPGRPMGGDGASMTDGDDYSSYGKKAAFGEHLNDDDEQDRELSSPENGEEEHSSHRHRNRLAKSPAKPMGSEGASLTQGMDWTGKEEFKAKNSDKHAGIEMQ